jgi:CheY-like chemotaxis protein/curved DNA-binding protein CbpA
MSKKVLIIDDEPAAAEAIAEVCREIGLSVEVVGVPAKAVEVFKAAPADLVIVDLLMPGMDGYMTGGKIRALPGGANVPMIAVSGVLKQSSVSREVWNRIRAEFLAKPFDVATLKALVSRKLGLEAGGETRRARRAAAPAPQAQPFQSDLGRDPVYRILARLYEQRASGHLDLVRGKARRRLTFHMGQLRFATSNLKQENVGGMQVARGELTEAVFAACVEKARAQRTTLADVLVANRVMTPQAMSKALAEQVRAVGTGALGWADGQATFVVDSDGAAHVPDHRVHPLEIVVQGIARYYTADSIKQFLQGKRQAYLHRTDLLERELFILRRSTPGETLTVAVTGKTTLGELLDRARPEDMPLLFALVGTGLGRLEKAPQGALGTSAPSGGQASATPSAAPPVASPASAAPAASPASAAPAASPASATPAASPTSGAVRPPPVLGGGSPPTMHATTPPGVAPAAQVEGGSSPGAVSEEARRARDEIDAEHRRIEEADHFAVLGVSQKADADAVQKAYLAAASRWHVDRFAGLDLGPSRERLDALFARIGEARAVLVDEEKRKDYEVYLDRKAQGLPTDVEAILRAEGCFQDGEKLLKAGKASQALALFEEAISLNDSEAEFYAWRGYARFRAEGETALAEAKADIDRSLAADKTMAAPNYFLGMIAFHQGNLDEAQSCFKRVLIHNPEHQESAQQLRTLKARQEKKGGVFGKLFKR